MIPRPVLGLLYVFLAAALPTNAAVARKPASYRTDGVRRSSNSSLSNRAPDFDYKTAFPGIHWDIAETTCEPDEFDIIVEATRMANEMINYFEKTDRYDKTPAWHRYFVKDESLYFIHPNGWHGNEFTQSVYLNIRNNIRQAAAFPTTGKRNKAGHQGRRQKVAYSCTAPLPPATPNSCQWDEPGPGQRWTGPSATTSRPAQNNDEGWLIVFCPRFFKDRSLNGLRYLNDITKEPKSESSLPTLRSYEYVIAHEWMHTSLFGFKDFIDDLKADLPAVGNVPATGGVVSVYGDRYCHQFAWENQVSNPRKINIFAGDNADNYAWMYQYHWYARAFGWTSDGSVSKFAANISKAQDDELDSDPLDNIDPVTVTDGWTPPQASSTPINCHGWPEPLFVVELADDIQCAYVGEEYDQFVEDVKTGFKSVGGCDLS
ncbi:hypothetical protein PRZ48_007453 [Zasmidium cellare]|uniref:Uncharacterized protein n=1 Tax=Zasmidium cellare TaxID=395010 RepID=A0ABR0EJT0_ZASCE|nr:hypothetical protein PRZ48_007453 [Zasmidium cellare]